MLFSQKSCHLFISLLFISIKYLILKGTMAKQTGAIMGWGCLDLHSVCMLRASPKLLPSSSEDSSGKIEAGWR